MGTLPENTEKTAFAQGPKLIQIRQTPIDYAFQPYKCAEHCSKISNLI